MINDTDKLLLNYLEIYIFSFSELSRLTLACDEVSELVQYLHTIETTDYTSGLSKLPACMSGLVTNIILGKDHTKPNITKGLSSTV